MGVPGVAKMEAKTAYLALPGLVSIFVATLPPSQIRIQHDPGGAHISEGVASLATHPS